MGSCGGGGLLVRRGGGVEPGEAGVSEGAGECGGEAERKGMPGEAGAESSAVQPVGLGEDGAAEALNVGAAVRGVGGGEVVGEGGGVLYRHACALGEKRRERVGGVADEGDARVAAGGEGGAGFDAVAFPRVGAQGGKPGQGFPMGEGVGGVCVRVGVLGDGDQVDGAGVAGCFGEGVGDHVAADAAPELDGVGGGD